MADVGAFCRTVRIVNNRGLHARAAARFTELAEGFTCDIRVERGREEVTGRSIMGLLLLGGTKGARITITTSGDDSEEALKALEALCALVQDGFGENDEEDGA